MGAAETDRRRRRRACAAMAGLLFGNELLTAVYALWDRFGRTKVLASVEEGALAVVARSLPAMLGMLALALLGTWALAAVWARAATIVYGAWVGARAPGRLGRRLYWFLAGYVLVHAYYSVHALLFPASQLAGAPLVVLSGAYDALEPWARSPRALLLPATALVLLGGLAAALVLDRRFAHRAACGALALAALVAGYERLTGPGPVRPFTHPGNVVLLGLDSFQANRLRSGGAPVDAAPRADALLAESHRFEQAWTPFARTYPSWISILTGRWPTRHGVRFNLVADHHLAPDNRYLAHALADAGYATLHATDEVRFSIVRPLFGYERQVHPVMGIADFVLGSFFDFSVANLARRTALGHDAFAPIKGNRASAGYDPGLWVRDVEKALQALPRDRPVLVTAHLCGNHFPFSAPGAYHWRSEDPVANCMAMVDDQLGALLDYFAASGLSERALTVLLSDHGDGWEGPGDRANTHGDHLDRPWANRCLLALSGPGIAPARSDALVRTIDVYPTVLEWAGVPHDPATIDGRSLLPFLGDPARDDGRRVFAESGFDKKTFTVGKLIEEEARWYRVDERTGLVLLRDEGLPELIAGKSYMLLENGLRLVVVPERASFRILADDGTGTERDVTDEVPVVRRRALLVALARHFGLAMPRLIVLATRRGFLTHA